MAVNPLKHRLIRLAAGFLALVLTIATVVVSVKFVPAYIDDPSLANQAGYLGTIMGGFGLVVGLVQFMLWLRRRERAGDLAERLRTQIRDDCVRRLGHMQRTSEHIALTFRGRNGPAARGSDDLVGVLRGDRGRVVLLAGPGHGKSYTTLQLALDVVRTDPGIVPLVIPLGRWIQGDELGASLVGFLATDFNVSRLSAEDLINSGKVVPLFDGLDELCADETSVEPAETFLRELLDWRVQAVPAPFLLTSRRTVWNRLAPDLRHHYSTQEFSISPVGATEAERYLSRSLGGTDTFDKATELTESLRHGARRTVLASPWRLSLIAELAQARLALDGGRSGADLITSADIASPAALVAQYVRSAAIVPGPPLRRIRNVLDLWWLTKYARYLEHNRTANAHLAGRALPSRDIILHRLWPVAGEHAPRIVDFVLCAVLSAPGFLWAAVFLWPRGLTARSALVVGMLSWSLLLARTSLKPWVRAATPDWSRLTDPKFAVRQTGTALVAGAVVWVVAEPVIALIAFATAWLGVGLTVGFGQTLAADTRPELVGPYGVLRRERLVSRLSAAVAFPMLAWGFTQTWGFPVATVAAGIYCVIVGETVACALWRRYLAMIVASAFRLPPAPNRCLRRMSRLGFIRVAGISYQFRHDELIDYFARGHDPREHYDRQVRHYAVARHVRRRTPVE